MWRDPIVEEVRRVRKKYARRFNYDLAAIVRDVQARQRSSGESFVDRSIGPPDGKPGARRRAAPSASRKRKRRRPVRRVQT